MRNFFRSDFLAIHLGRFKFYRKWYGARWEYWFNVETCSRIWMRIESHYSLGYAPWGCVQRINREIYNFGRLLDQSEWKKYQSDAEIQYLTDRGIEVTRA